MPTRCRAPGRRERRGAFNLCPGRIEYAKDGTVRTLFDDGNNIRIKTSATVPVQIREEEGWVSTAYRKKEERPAYAVEAQKTAGGELLFITVIAPDRGAFPGFDSHRSAKSSRGRYVPLRGARGRQNVRLRV